MIKIYTGPGRIGPDPQNEAPWIFLDIQHDAD